MYQKPSFQVVTQTYGRDGNEQRIITLYRRGRAEQMALMDRAIVGYDPHHPDSPASSIFKFSNQVGAPCTPSK